MSNVLSMQDFLDKKVKNLNSEIAGILDRAVVFQDQNKKAFSEKMIEKAKILQKQKTFYKSRYNRGNALSSVDLSTSYVG